MRFDNLLRFLAAVAIVGLTAGTIPAYAQDAFQKGLDAYLEGEYSKALDLWRPAAESGDEVAAFNIGVLYARGLGVEADPAEAIRWYRQSALAGYPNAQFNLGAAYYNGTGVDRNIGQAVSWWQKAAEQHHPEAMYNLATLYRDGKGVKRDIERATQLFKKAADAGDTRAKVALVRIKEAEPAEQTDTDTSGTRQASASDTGPAEKEPKASAWPYNADPGHWAVQVFAVAREAAARRFVADHDLADTIRVYRAETDGKTWFKGVSGVYPDQAAAQAARRKIEKQVPGSSPWIRRYRDIQAEAVAAVPLNPQDGREASGESAPEGAAGTSARREEKPPPVTDDETAQESAGETSQSGADEPEAGTTGAGTEPVSGDQTEEPSQSADVSDPQAQLRKGQKAFNAQRYDEALAAWRPLAQQGVADAQYGVGFMYESGWGVEKDYSQAYHWYQLAAQQGHVKSQFNLGMLYKNGNGVAQNDALALYWIQTAADRGDERALSYLKDMN